MRVLAIEIKPSKHQATHQSDRQGEKSPQTVEFFDHFELLW